MVLSFLAMSLTSIATLGTAQPVYPLYAIDSLSHTCGDGRCTPATEQDAHVIATNFSYIHGGYTNVTLARFHQINPDFKPVSYINSHSAEASEVETTDGGRLGVAYYVIGTLQHPVAISDTKFTLLLGKKMSPPKASTVAGNVSTKDGYVTFFRLGDELVRVDKVENDSDDEVTVTVTRGFDATQASAHDASEDVFAPVYKSYPGQGSVSYCLDPGQRFGVQRLIEYTLSVIGNHGDGSSGSWLDCFSLGLLGAADAYGQGVKVYWDFVSKAEYTKATMLQKRKRRLTTLFEGVRSKIGQYPTILANNIGHSYLPENEDLRELLIANASENFRPLDGYSLENFAGDCTSFNKTEPCDPDYIKMTWHPVDKWLGNVQTIMAAAQEKTAVFPIMACAGCKSTAAELCSYRDQFESFAYASFLLGVEEQNGSIHLGVPAFYRDGERRYAHVHPRYFYDIGKPQRSVKPEDVNSYKLPNPHTTYTRPFSKGLVLVNPYNTTDHNVRLNGSYFNPDTKQVMSSLNVAAQSGYILLHHDDSD